MKIFIELEINRIDPESVKGEQFDEELESAVNDINIDGWEVSKVNITREKPEQSGKNKYEKIAIFLIQLAREEDALGNKLSIDDEWSNGITYRQKLKDYAEELTGIKYKL